MRVCDGYRVVDINPEVELLFEVTMNKIRWRIAIVLKGTPEVQTDSPYFNLS